MVRGGALLASVFVLLLAAVPTSVAQERPSVVVGTLTPELVPADAGWTVETTLVNITDEQFALNSQPAELADADCRPRVPATLPPARISSVTVRVPEDCDLTGKAFEFEIDVERTGDQVGSFRKTVASLRFKALPRDGNDGTDWALVAAVLAPLAALALLAAWDVSRQRSARRADPADV